MVGTLRQVKVATRSLGFLLYNLTDAPQGVADTLLDYSEFALSAYSRSIASTDAPPKSANSPPDDG
jgi:hypothetical protein